MTAPDLLAVVAAIVTFGCGSVLLGYTDRAMSQGWQTGSLLQKPIVSSALGLVLIAWGLFLSWPLGSWSIALTVAGGFAFSFALMKALGEWSRIALFLGPAVGIGSTVLEHLE